MVLKMRCFGEFYCSFTGTIVPAQYGGLSCLFAPAVTVFWLAAVRPQSIDFLSTVRNLEPRSPTFQRQTE